MAGLSEARCPPAGSRRHWTTSRPERWDFTEELLELLWVLEATIAMQPEGENLLDAVLRSELFSDIELPTPADEERKPPRNVRAAVVQGTLGVE